MLWSWTGLVQVLELLIKYGENEQGTYLMKPGPLKTWALVTQWTLVYYYNILEYPVMLLKDRCPTEFLSNPN